MKFNQTLTAAITAAALVAGAGFAYAQSGTTPGAPGDLNRQGGAEMKAPDVNPAAGTTMQSQPSTGTTTGTSVDNSATMQSGTVMPEPRADRN
jgi:hypothetical protein